MRTIICCMSLLTTTLFVGCGQMGPLQLPSDPDFDNRAKYLLYKNKVEPTQVKKEVEQIQQPADSQAAASEISETN